MTTVLLTEQDDGSFHPCALPIDARGDNYGGLDSFQSNEHSEHLLRAVRVALDTGRMRLECDEPIKPEDDDATAFGKMIRALWFDASDGKRTVFLGDRLLRAAMIAREVAAALTEPPASPAQGAKLEREIAWPGQGEYLYGSRNAAPFEQALERFVRLQDALRMRRIEWRPIGPTSCQFSGPEERLAIHQAARRYAQDLPVSRALLQAAQYHHDESLTLADLGDTGWLDGD